MSTKDAMDNPYQVGAELRIRVADREVPLIAKIKHFYEPSTMAVVVKVSFEDTLPFLIDHPNETFILKLYDRRFATGLRKSHRAPPYTSALEADYIEDLLERPPGSEVVADPSENFLTARISGDEDNELTPSKHKPDAWKHDPDCPNYSGTGEVTVPDSQSTRGEEENALLHNDNKSVQRNTETDRGGKEQGQKGPPVVCDEAEKISETDAELNGRLTETSDASDEEENDVDFGEDQCDEDDEGDEYHEDESSDDEDEDVNDDAVSLYDTDLYGTPVENLRSIQWRCLYLANCERKVYERLQPLQQEGKVPTYFASIELVVESLSLSPDQFPKDMLEKMRTNIKEYLRIPGALISIIPEDAFPALDLKDHAPPEDWTKGLRAAGGIVNEWGDYGVYNEDARPENIMLRKLISNEGSEYQAIAFDFAQARLRRPNESDQEWKEHKYRRDEEGAVLAVMRGSRGLDWGQKYSWRTERMGGTARYFVPEDDMVYRWGGGCTGEAFV